MFYGFESRFLFCYICDCTDGFMKHSFSLAKRRTGWMKYAKFKRNRIIEPIKTRIFFFDFSVSISLCTRAAGDVLHFL